MYVHVHVHVHVHACVLHTRTQVVFGNYFYSFSTAKEDSHLPFLITSLVSNDRRLSGTVSSHVQWIEKLLGEVERFELYTSKVQAKKQQGGAKKDPPPAEEKPFAYGLQEMFPHDFSPIRRSDINHGQGYHACLPNVLYRTRRGMAEQDCYLLRPLLHYTNYFYPLMVDSKIEGNVRIGESSQTGQNSLTVARTIAIGRVNHWINTRLYQYPLKAHNLSCMCNWKYTVLHNNYL